jgi:polyhydroxyalkanoate synthesis regulator phasin
MGRKWTEEKLNKLSELYIKLGCDWNSISEGMMKSFDDDFTADSCESAYYNILRHEESTDEEISIKTLQGNTRAIKTNAVLRKQNKVLIENSIFYEDVINTIKKATKEINTKGYKAPRVSNKIAKGRETTIEIMLSDLHFGLETETFNTEIAKERLRKVVKAVKDKINNFDKNKLKLDRIILALLGDLIENARMHQMESLSACHNDLPQQISDVSLFIFYEVILPLSELGVVVDIPCVPGNHDRLSEGKTYNKPGLAYGSYIIYTWIESLVKAHKIKNVNFYVTDNLYQSLDIYGDVVLYEHGDHIRTYSEDNLRKFMAARSRQIGKQIKFYRLGDKHDVKVFGGGEIIVNGCLFGNNGYSTIKGYHSDYVHQVINTYIKTDKPRPCLYDIFPVHCN